MICGMLGGSGLLVSVAAVFLGGVDFPDFIIKPIVSAIIMAILGAGIYFLLEWQVPILFEMENEDLDKGEGLTESEDITEEIQNTEDNSLYKTDQDLKDPGWEYQSDINEKLSLKEAKPPQNTSAREGEIVVEGVTFKNKPKIMAETIKTLLDQDENEAQHGELN